MLTDTTAAAADKIRCDACPVMCYIKPGAAGACDATPIKMANWCGSIRMWCWSARIHGGRLVPFQAAATGTARSCTSRTCSSPPSAPAPPIPTTSRRRHRLLADRRRRHGHGGTEGIFSYCGVKVKIDTDRYLGPETATVRVQGEASAMSPPANTARRCCRSVACTI